MDMLKSNRLRQWIKVGQYRNVSHVKVLYLEFIHAATINITDLTKSSWFYLRDVCYPFKIGDNSVDCVIVNDRHRLTSAAR